MKFLERTILNSCPIILRFTIVYLVEISYREAFKTKLCDLKNLINLNNMSDLDLTLLKELDDPKVNNLLGTINVLHEFIKVFLIINGMDEEDCDLEEGSFDLAENFHNLFYYSLINEESDDWEISWTFLITLGMIYQLIELFVNKEIDLGNEDLSIVFLDGYYEVDDFKIKIDPADDKNAVLLYDLFIEIEQKFWKVQEQD